jgi:omega-hydroxy-beta-dihydromenaquinone-9 sulfotransferase
MSVLSSRFYYVRFPILLQILRYTFGSWRPRLWLITTGFFIVFFINLLLHACFRLLDEIFYRGYQAVQIKQPVFIISNPRSGTTYLHRLMSLDAGRFTYTRYAHTFFMTASFTRLCAWVGIIDSYLGKPLRRALTWLDDKLWGGWEDIHPMGFNKPEEDELPFAQMLMSPGIFIPYPFFHLIHDNKMLDQQPASVRDSVMDYYESCVQRFVYATGVDKTYLSKNVMSTGRIQAIMERFPDARIIYIARHPYDSVPSTASMFTSMYEHTCPDLPRDNPSAKAWMQLAIDFIQHIADMRQTIPATQLITVKYDDLISAPQKTVLDIYAHFGWEVSSHLSTQLDKETIRTGQYQSAHEYSLAEFGISKEEIYTQLKPFFEEFGFEQ